MFMIAIAVAALATSEIQAASAFPELSAEALAPAIIQDLKRTLPDAYSIRDLTICAPHKLKLKDGKPFSWAVQIGFNSKGPNGGYTGLAAYVVGFKQGVINLHAFSAMAPGGGAFAHLINDKSINKVIDCSRVSDARVQELLGGTAALSRD